MNNLTKRFGLLAALALPGFALAETPVSLHIDAPNSNGDIVLLSESGWPITIKMVVKSDDMLGFAKFYNFANKNKFGFIVFEDPDGCPWMDDDDWRNGNGGLPPLGCEPFIDEDTFEVVAEEDETYLEFRPDVDEAGMPDNSGDIGEQAELVDSAGSNGPEFQRDESDPCVPDTGDADCFKFGPQTGGEEVDGFGYGNDDDLPGLFVYIEVGTGLVYDEPDFDLSGPVGVRNLAGMLNSVSYDLSDITKTNSKSKGQKGKPTVTLEAETRVWAHINMPGQLVRNIMQYDACVGTPIFDDPPYDDEIVGCEGDDEWRIDGGATETAPQNFGRGDAASIYQLENSVFTVHAFMVSGHAPDVLFDTNGDGSFIDDAEAAGYNVISNVDSIDLLQLSNTICWGGGGSVMVKDLDSNGASIVPIVCPTAPGSIGEPPR